MPEYEIVFPKDLKVGDSIIIDKRPVTLLAIGGLCKYAGSFWWGGYYYVEFSKWKTGIEDFDNLKDGFKPFKKNTWLYDRLPIIRVKGNIEGSFS